MRIRVTLKDPDTMHDAVAAALRREAKPDGLTKSEWADICEARASQIQAAISREWMEYGEYLVVDFWVGEDCEPEDARIVPNRDLKD